MLSSPRRGGDGGSASNKSLTTMILNGGGGGGGAGLGSSISSLNSPHSPPSNSSLFFALNTTTNNNKHHHYGGISDTSSTTNTTGSKATSETQPPLHWSKLLSRKSLIGRTTEIEWLKEKLDQTIAAARTTTTTTTTSPLSSQTAVLVGGSSGVGKTALVQHALEDYVLHQHNGCYISGKFDQYEQQQQHPSGESGGKGSGGVRPYGIMTDVLHELVATTSLYLQQQQQPINHHSNERLESIRTKLKKTLSEEDCHLLEGFIPGLEDSILGLSSSSFLGNSSSSSRDEKEKKEVVAVTDDETPQPPSTTNHLSQRATTEYTHLQSLARILTSFLKCIASKTFPIVLFWDDVQWADQGSQELLTAMVEILITEESQEHKQQDQEERKRPTTTDTTIIGPILFVLAFRTDNVRTFHLPTTITTSTATSVLDVQPLSLASVHELIVTLLDQSDDDYGDITASTTSSRSSSSTEALAELVCTKTQGNVYFTLQFVEQLHRDGLLQFSYMLHCWKWDLDVIRSSTKVTENVAQVLSTKIATLPQEVQLILIVAASLGFSVSQPILKDLYLACREIVYQTCSVSGCGQEASQQEHDDDIGEIASNDKEVEKKTPSPSAAAAVSYVTIETLGMFGQEFDTGIEIASSNGLIEISSSAAYHTNKIRFSHDKVQRTLLSMIPLGIQGQVLYQTLGESLFEMYNASSQQQEWMLFALVDLLHKGLMGDDVGAAGSASLEKTIATTGTNNIATSTMIDSLTFATLCETAAQKAARKSAFRSAAGYADRAIGVLTRHSNHNNNSTNSIANEWKDHYDMIMRLSALSAEMHYSNGDFEKCQARTDAILSHATSIRDQEQAQFIRISMLGASRHVREAVEEGISLLRQLGLQLPLKPTKLHLLLLIRKTRKMLKGRRAEALWTLPEMTNPQALEWMRILSLLAFHAYQARFQVELLIFNVQMMYQTLCHGISPYSPLGMTAYGGTIALLFKDLQGGYEFGALALELVKQPKFRMCLPRALLIGHTFLHHLKMPFQSSLKPLMRAYQVAMELGEIEFAGAALRIHACLSIFLGMPLGPLERQLVGYCTWFQAYSHESAMVMVQPWLQLTQNLLGKGKDHLKLTGDTINEDQFLAKLEHNRDEHAILNLSQARLVLCYMFGDIQLAEAERVKIASAKSMDGTHLMKIFMNIFSGLTCFAMARNRNRWYYQRQGRRCMKELQQYVDGGSVNGAPLLKLLEAEELASSSSSLAFHPRRRKDQTLHAFGEAIKMSARCGFRLFKGIACERTGLFLLSLGDTLAAENYLRDTFVEYREYGATQKLVQLEKDHEYLSLNTMPLSRNSTIHTMRPVVLDEWNLDVKEE